jgi:hypothetical protein
LEEIVAAPVKKTENTTEGIRCADHATPSIRNSWYYFAKKRRSLGRHSSLADQSHGVGLAIIIIFLSTLSVRHHCILEGMWSYAGQLFNILFKNLFMGLRFILSQLRIIFCLSFYINKFCKRKICHCPYAISGYRTNEIPNVGRLHERM